MDAYDDSALFPAFRGILPTNTFGVTGQSPHGFGPVMRGGAESSARAGGATTGTSQGSEAGLPGWPPNTLGAESNVIRGRRTL